MRPRTPLPPEVGGAPFLSSESLDHGLTASRIRRDDIDRPFHGVSGVELDLSTVLGRCRAFEPLLREGQAFSHITALSLLGAPLPSDVGAAIHLSVLFPRTPPRGRGVIGHSLRRLSPTLEFGLPTSEPASAWCQSAALLRREDLVAVGDYLVTGRRRGPEREPGRVSTAELMSAAIEHRGSPGASRMAWALARIRVGVDSRPETMLRLLLLQAGLRTVDVDFPIPVERGLVLHGDVVFVRERVVLEYEGDGHRVDRETWMRDIERRELMESAGWRVVRVTAQDLFRDPDRFLARLRQILASRRADLSK